jgi:hypothetical protein
MYSPFTLSTKFGSSLNLGKLRPFIFFSSLDAAVGNSLAILLTPQCCVERDLACLS